MSIATDPSRIAAPNHGRRTRQLAAWVTAAVLVVGLGLRIRAYQARASFFSDEASLVRNFRAHTAWELVRHLDYEQAAPPIFLWVGRAMYLRFGPNECALRLLPLAGGLLSLTFFAMLAWRTLPPWIATIAVAWFAFCEELITFSAELKQYSTDACIAVLLFCVVFVWDRESSPAKRLAKLSIIAACSLWLSHPTIILFAAYGLILLWQCRRAGTRALAIGLLSGTLVGVSFLVLYFISIRHQHSRFLLEFWAAGFPDGSKPLRFVPWLVRQTYQLIDIPCRGLAFIYLPLAVLGVIELRGRRNDLLAACVLPIGLTALAACVGQYPYNGSRLTLFLVPTVFLLCAFGLAWLRWCVPSPASQFFWLAGLPLVVLPMASAAHRIIHPRYNSHVRPAVVYVRQHLKPGEAIYLLGEPGSKDDLLHSPGYHHELLAYWPDAPAVVHTHVESLSDIHEKRFWVVLAYRPHRRDTLRLFDEFEKIADPVGPRFIVPEGGAACLFQLRVPS